MSCKTVKIILDVSFTLCITSLILELESNVLHSHPAFVPYGSNAAYELEVRARSNHQTRLHVAKEI